MEDEWVILHTPVKTLIDSTRTTMSNSYKIYWFGSKCYNVYNVGSKCYNVYYIGSICYKVCLFGHTCYFTPWGTFLRERILP
jgi:hypothetical protein